MLREKFKNILSPLTATFLGILFLCPAVFIALPKNNFSEVEKRALQAAPELSVSTLTDGTFTAGTESYLSDHFPARLGLVGLHSYFTLLCGENGAGGVYRGRSGWLFNGPVMVDKTNFHQNLQAMSSFAQSAGAPAYLMAVPTSGAVESEELPADHQPYPDSQLLAEAKKSLSGSVQWVDITGLFAKLTNKPALYYRTDHHWTSEGAYMAYRAFCGLTKMATVPAAAFAVSNYPGFYGTIYSKSGLWAAKPDTLSVWQDKNLHLSVTVSDEIAAKVIRTDSPFFMAQLAHPDKYPVFLDGNHSLVTIKNEAAPARRLLIIKDSYADCLAPFLAENYREIDLIDLRYFRRQTVSQYIKNNRPDEVLFVYGLDSLVNDRNIPLLY